MMDMPTHSINFLAVLVAAVAYMALGAIWYSPILFSKAWMKAIGKSKEEITKGHSAISYVWAIVTAFVASYGIARLMLWTGRDTISDGILIGLLAGVCFVMTAFWVNDVFEQRKCALPLINGLYHVVGLIVAGVIIGAF
jgi:hypothetical protein